MMIVIAFSLVMSAVFVVQQPKSVWKPKTVVIAMGMSMRRVMPV